MIKSTMEVVRHLMQYGEIDRKKDSYFYESFENLSDDALKSIRDTFECDCIKNQNGDKIYLIPKMQNTFLGINTTEFQRLTKSNNRKSTYLNFYMIMVMLNKFYKGKNADPKCIPFLQVSDFIKEVDNRLQAILDKEEQEVFELENKHRINLAVCAKEWLSKIPDEEKGSNKNTKHRIVENICRFLEEQKLAYLKSEEDAIYPMPKLDALMRVYYLKNDRKNQIDEALERNEL